MENLKIDCVSLANVEILETGIWNGLKMTDEDLDEMVKNFNDKVIEPFLNLDHDDKFTDKVKQALKVVSLGFVSSLKREGSKLVADFKQVPLKVADLIKSGMLKKRSVEFFSKGFKINGKSFNNVLKAVSFFGADIPAVNSLSDDFDILLKLEKNSFSNTENEGVIKLNQKISFQSRIGDRIRSLREGKDMSLDELATAISAKLSGGSIAGNTLSQIETGSIAVPSAPVLSAIASVLGVGVGTLEGLLPSGEEPIEGGRFIGEQKLKKGKGMETIEIPKSEHDSLVAFKSESEGTIVSLKSEVETLKAEKVVLEKFKDDIAKEKVEALKVDADTFVNGIIADGKLLPKFKDMYVADYISKSETPENLKLFKEDCEGRDKVIELGEVIKDGKKVSAVDFSDTAKANEAIEAKMKADGTSYDVAAKALGLFSEGE